LASFLIPPKKYCSKLKRVKIGFHAHFDEGMNDIATANLPLNVVPLQRVQNDTPLLPKTVELVAPPFGFTLQPFAKECNIYIHVSSTNSTFGFHLATDTDTNQAYLSKVLLSSTAEKLCSSAPVS
jgi:hypothetical protein